MVERSSIRLSNLHVLEFPFLDINFERDIVDTYSTPHVVRVHFHLPDPISYYMKGKLERTNESSH